LLNEKGNAMNVKTEARNEISSPETKVSGTDSSVLDRQLSGGQRRGLWIVALALVSSAGLATAAAAFDTSSDADDVTPTITTEAVDPVFNNDVDREPGQAPSDDGLRPYGSGLSYEAH
jgi:hypothetical protein